MLFIFYFILNFDHIDEIVKRCFAFVVVVIIVEMSKTSLNCERIR